MSARRRGVLVTPLALIAVVAGMAALAFASVPLYRLFRETTGYGGTVRATAVAPAAVAPAAGNRVFTVRFDANVYGALPWRFRPAQRQITVRAGDRTRAFYTAENGSDRPATGRATFNVAPLKAGQYVKAVDCFCFEPQRLAPGAETKMAVTFFIDPAIADDRGLDDVRTITLSYTFFRAAGTGETDGAPARLSSVTNHAPGRAAN